jgi:hypothetical protein
MHANTVPSMNVASVLHTVCCTPVYHPRLYPSQASPQNRPPPSLQHLPLRSGRDGSKGGNEGSKGGNEGSKGDNEGSKGGNEGSKGGRGAEDVRGC